MIKKNDPNNVIIGIETSCDDTAISCINLDGEILFDKKNTQTIHEKYGGVVPEIAAREHLEMTQELTLELAKFLKSKSLKPVSVGATCLNGMPGGLVVGASCGLGLATGFGCKFIPINHLEGHLLSVQIENTVPFPFLSILISGGHSMIVLCEAHEKYKILSQSIDDSAGELFDKSARAMNIGYPGGPEIEKMAKNGKKGAFSFPIAMPKSSNFSFSGIKTSVFNLISRLNEKNELDQNIPSISLAIQDCVTQNIIDKLNKCIKKIPNVLKKIKHLSLCGGVASNEYIRNSISNWAKDHNMKCVSPSIKYCTDNAAMIAWAALQKTIEQKNTRFFGIRSRFSIEQS